MQAIWYVSYGSNILSDRFRVYLEGGRFAGSSRHHPGSSDPTPPSGTEHCTIDGAMYFAGNSTSWGGGGVAFFDPDAAETAWAKRYRISPQQFADVQAQETGHDPVMFDWDRLAAQGQLVLGSGWYDRIVWLGAVDGSPMVTFTSPSLRTDLAPPSEAYKNTIAAGLRDRPSTSEAEIRRYLETRPCASH